MSELNKKGIFYGWWIVGVSAFLVFLDGGIGFYSYGVFYLPFEQEFGWGRAEVAFGMSIYTITYGAMGFLAGRLTDSYGPKTLMIIGAVVMGITFISRSFITDLWHLYLLMAIMGAGVASFGGVPVAAVIANWFVKKRGLATGLAMTGIGLGGLFMVPLAQYLITILGWRLTTGILGGAGVAIVIPLILTVMKTRPSEVGALPDGENPNATSPTSEQTEKAGSSQTDESTSGLTPSVSIPSSNWSLAESMRTRTFWFVTLAFGLLNLASGAVLTHEVPYLIDMGISPQSAAAALGFTAGMGVIGKLVAGVLVDRIGSRGVLVLLAVLQALGVVILLGTKEMTMVWIFVAVFGFGMGGTVTVRPTIVAEAFGVQNLGAIYGLLAGFATLGGAIGPVVAGMLFDSTRSYMMAMLAVIVAYVIAIAFMVFIRAPKKDALLQPETAGASTTR